MMTSSFFNDLFHKCAWIAFMEATAVGKQDDSEYIRKMAYSYYETELKECKKNDT